MLVRPGSDTDLPFDGHHQWEIMDAMCVEWTNRWKTRGGKLRQKQEIQYGYSKNSPHAQQAQSLANYIKIHLAAWNNQPKQRNTNR